MKRIYPLFILLMIVVCTASCKGNPDKKQEETQLRLNSFKINYQITSRGDSLKGVLCSLEYDEQGRLLVYNEDTLHYAFDYTAIPGHIATTCTLQKDGSIVSSGMITTRADGAFVKEENRYEQHGGVAGGGPTTITAYTCNEQGYLLHLRQSGANPLVSYPDTLELTLNWDDAGNVKRGRMSTVFPGKKKSAVYTFEYMDKEMPCYFYPEAYVVFGMSLGSGLVGANGYGHKNLLKRITAKSAETGALLLVFDFVYQYGADGKLTECLIKVATMNPDDSSTKLADEYIRYYDLTY